MRANLISLRLKWQVDLSDSSSKMWKPLKAYDGHWHYEDSRSVDWSPMRRLLSVWIEREYAASIRAFNSLDTLVLTTAPEYKDREEHDSVAIAYDLLRRFSIRYDGFRSKQSASYLCHESQALSLVDALVLRLAMSAEARAVREPQVREDQPTFNPGDHVKVILNERNKTPRQGRIARVVRHIKKQRYYYFLEVDGKAVSKRYYADDLTRA